jgi:PAS domain S-box-containing protein
MTIDEEYLDPDIESLFNDTPETEFNGARTLIAELDPSLRVVSSVCIDLNTDARAALRPQSSFETLFPSEPLKSVAAAHLDAVLAGEVRSFDFERRRSDGAGRVSLSLIPRFHAAGSCNGFFVIARDISEKDAVDVKLRALGDRLSAILDHAADAIIMISETGIIEQANKAAETIFGWTPEELVGQPVSMLMATPYNSAHQRYLEEYLRTRESGILNVGPRLLPALAKDGSPLAIEISVGEATIGNTRKFVGVCRDVAERLRQQDELRRANRALEEKIDELEKLRAALESQRKKSDELAEMAERARAAAERANAAKSRLLATVSHELRTPLNGVMAVADLLAMGDLNPRNRELVEIIRRSGHDLGGLVNDVLDLSKLEAGALDIVPEPFSPTELVDTLGAVWAVAAEAKGLSLTIESQPLPLCLVGDAARLRQVLANVISNSIKYTSQGSVTLSVRVAAGAQGCARLAFVVTDTGPGIDEDLRSRLFEPYARGASEHSRRETGTGLGLAISRQLVSMMGGAIEADNAPGGGARIAIALELPIGAAPAPEARHDQQAAAQLDRAVRILVAEDHAVNRRILGLLLDQLGAEYVMVEDGEAAVAAASAEDFDLILMDVRMPRMDGLEATRMIRAGAGRAPDIPILAVTADAMPGDDPEISGAGVTAVLAKPVTLASLAAAIGAALARGTHQEAMNTRAA